MMQRLWAILRTIFLLVIVGFAMWASPWMPTAAGRPLAEQYDRIAYAFSQTQKALWLAIAWIALEAVIAWLVVWKNARSAHAALKSELKAVKTQLPQPDKSNHGP